MLAILSGASAHPPILPTLGFESALKQITPRVAHRVHEQKRNLQAYCYLSRQSDSASQRFGVKLRASCTVSKTQVTSSRKKKIIFFYLFIHQNEATIEDKLSIK